jgi:hypothetical protein
MWYSGGVDKDNKTRYDPINAFGKRIEMNFEKLKRDAFFLAERVRDTDARAIAKFGLPTTNSADMALLGSMLKAMAQQSS